MALYGGKIGATAEGWLIPDQREQTLPSGEQARGLLVSMRSTAQGMEQGGYFLSEDGRIGGGPVGAMRTKGTEGHGTIAGKARAIRVDWEDDDEYEHTFYIADVAWKGRAGLEGIVRAVLREIATKPGKPTIAKDGSTQKRRQISLDDARAAKAREIGGRNLSEGIRMAIDAYRL